MKELTDRQRQILEYLQTHFRAEGYWPSIRDIQNAFGFGSTNAVMGHLRALERKQAIERVNGQARAYRVVHNDREIPFPETDAGDALSIPIYGSIVAGDPDGVESGGEIGRLCIDARTPSLRDRKRAFALKVRGDSMVDAGILDGDVVILEPGEPRDSDIVAALIDGETTLKRFISGSGRTPYLKAENTAYPSLYPLNDLRVQGIARAVVRTL